MNNYTYYALIIVNLPLAKEEVERGTVKASSIRDATVKAMDKLEKFIQLGHNLNDVTIATFHIEQD